MRLVLAAVPGTESRIADLARATHKVLKSRASVASATRVARATPFPLMLNCAKVTDCYRRDTGRSEPRSVVPDSASAVLVCPRGVHRVSLGWLDGAHLAGGERATCQDDGGPEGLPAHRRMEPPLRRIYPGHRVVVRSGA